MLNRGCECRIAGKPLLRNRSHALRAFLKGLSRSPTFAFAGENSSSPVSGHSVAATGTIAIVGEEAWAAEYKQRDGRGEIVHEKEPPSGSGGAGGTSG